MKKETEKMIKTGFWAWLLVAIIAFLFGGTTLSGTIIGLATGAITLSGAQMYAAIGMIFTVIVVLSFALAYMLKEKLEKSFKLTLAIEVLAIILVFIMSAVLGKGGAWVYGYIADFVAIIVGVVEINKHVK